MSCPLSFMPTESAIGKYQGKCVARPTNLFCTNLMN